MDVRVGDLYATDRFGLSIEIFPPKTEQADALLQQTLTELAVYQPSLISCTYGAGGSTSKRTIDWCRTILDQFSLPAMAHFTCVGGSRDELKQWLTDARAVGVRNIMALRGDPPAGAADFKPHPDGLSYANELVTFIREHFPDMGIGVAGYPEKHPQAPSLEVDLQNLKRKVEAGGNAIYTQLFYNNDAFFRFWDACLDLGINVPIVPGVMPITEFARIQRIAGMCGAAIPEELSSRLAAAAEDNDLEAQTQIGVEFAIQQCRELIEQGVPGLHFYALNKSHACKMILDALGLAPATSA